MGFISNKTVDKSVMVPGEATVTKKAWKTIYEMIDKEY